MQSAALEHIVSFLTTPTIKAEREAFKRAFDSDEKQQPRSEDDMVAISEGARSMLLQSKAGSTAETVEESTTNPAVQRIKKLKEEIEKIKEEIEEIEKSNLSDEEKRKLIQEKQAHMQQLYVMLQKYTKIKGGYYGGTRALYAS